MKYTLIFFISSIPFLGMCQFSFDDDFESYITGTPINKQSTNWRLWDISKEIQSAYLNDKKSSSGKKSLYLHSPHWAGGPTDLVFPIAKYLNEGLIQIELMMYIDTSAGAYFNIQGAEKLGALYALHLSFDSDSVLSISNYKMGDQRTKIGAYPKDQWFKMSIHADLSENQWRILINDQEFYHFQNPINSISALNFFPRSNNGKSSFYIDDLKIEYQPKPKTNLYVDLLTAQTDQYALRSNYNKLKCEIVNRGRNNIHSIELRFNRFDGSTNTKRFNYLNLAQDQKIKLTWDSIYVMDKELINGSLEITSINDTAIFLTNNKKLDCSSNWVENMPNKAIFFEAMASNTCGYSPFLYAFIDQMKAKYGDLLIPVVNHHNDPLTVLRYDTNYLYSKWRPDYIGTPYFALNNEYDFYIRDACEQAFLQRLTEPSNVKLEIGAVYDTVKRRMNINFLTHFLMESDPESIYKIYITKNIIHKNDPSLDQANWYSSATSGKARGYEHLPDPIPAKDMVYNHVIKYILPNQRGEQYGTINPIQEGEILRREETITWPTSETDFENYDVTVLFYYSATAKRINLKDALKRGVVTSLSNDSQTKQNFNLYPNPVSDQLTLSYRSNDDHQSSIEIINSHGEHVHYVKEHIHAGDNIISIDNSTLLPGAYMLQLKTEKEFLTEKFVIAR